MGRLFGDEVVCLVSQNHPAVRRGWTDVRKLAGMPSTWRPCPPTPVRAAVIDDHLDSLEACTRLVSGALCPFRADTGHGGIELAWC